ncbi:Flp family type IVb pilin [Phenylobacterium deserti]|uniref:Flp family type IVb pilin n=1 Tax=Phenylobacterium deserti TaxID=1914756 RepID=A0A328AS59_9CAUL|nr:Flp family type IVb pilin [Phenylobacterium deserti]RAK57790.1 Flp family type IVb pilin [Phenylobacterium deserti]
MSNFVTRFLKNESGATAIEYGLIAALIAAVLAAILGTIGGNLQGSLEGLNTEITEAGAAAGAGG